MGGIDNYITYMSNEELRILAYRFPEKHRTFMAKRNEGFRHVRNIILQYVYENQSKITGKNSIAIIKDDIPSEPIKTWSLPMVDVPEADYWTIRNMEWHLQVCKHTWAHEWYRMFLNVRSSGKCIESKKPRKHLELKEGVNLTKVKEILSRFVVSIEEINRQSQSKITEQRDYTYNTLRSLALDYLILDYHGLLRPQLKNGVR
jgi:hypothetical protein